MYQNENRILGSYLLLLHTQVLNFHINNATLIFFPVMCASILILSFSQLVQAQNSDKVDLETYNAQLLNNIDEIPVLDAETPRELSDEVIGQSIASSTSSAISFAELNEENKAIESKSSYLRGKIIPNRYRYLPILPILPITYQYYLSIQPSVVSVGIGWTDKYRYR